MRRGDKAAALDRGARLVEQQSDTPDAALTALALAKIKMEDKDQQGARYYLQRVIDKAKQPALKDVARLRLARGMLSAGEAAAALDALKEVDMEAYGVPAQELKGDILVARNRIDAARSASRSDARTRRLFIGAGRQSTGAVADRHQRGGREGRMVAVDRSMGGRAARRTSARGGGRRAVSGGRH